MKKVHAVLCLFLLMLSLSSCSLANKKVEAFNEAYGKYINNDFTSPEQKSAYKKNLEKRIQSIDSRFLNDFLSDRTPMDFVYEFETIKSNSSLDWRDSICTTFWQSLQKHYGVQSTSSSDIYSLFNASEGYYVEHPDAEPQKRTTSFSANLGYNIFSGRDRIVTKEGEDTVDYYGDWAVLHHNVWHYDDGKLGWSGGVFYDTQGKGWVNTMYDEYFYKGHALGLDSTSPFEVLFIDGVLYYIEWSLGQSDHEPFYYSLGYCNL